jgi:CRISPR-associated protein Csd2
MSKLKGKIDFVLIVSAVNANPNGDPSNGNRPRENMEGFGEISDVCIKRKIRNRWQDLGAPIFVQSDERATDGFTSLRARAEGNTELADMFKKDKKVKLGKELCSKIACEQWLDVRGFGQVFAFKKSDVSLGVRGPISIHQAVSTSPVEIVSMQITKSVNSEATDGKASDTMGTKNRVSFGLYPIKGSVNVQLAEKTGFSQEDANLLKQALLTLFENDASSARPEGSMEVCRLYWWAHDEKTPAISTAKVHRSIHINEKKERPGSFFDYDISYESPGCKEPEVFDLV